MLLNTKIKQKLKADAHHLKPVVLLGEKGLTENIITEINISLVAHELIKIKIPTNDRALKKEIVEEICKKTKSSEIQLIGNIVIIYRKNPEPKVKKEKVKTKRR